MLKKTLAFTCLTLSMGANAAIYDLDADTNERAGGDGDGLEIHYGAGDFILSAYNYASGSPYGDATKIYAYLDDSGGQDGGGACQTDNCAGIPDDNLSRVNNNEMLGLEITGGGAIEALSLWGDHQDYVPDQVLIDIDGFGIGSEFALFDVSWRVNGEAFIDLGINASSQLFITTIDENKSSELYLSAVYTDGSLPPVPVPAAAWLFGSALLGLIGISRRRKA